MSNVSVWFAGKNGYPGVISINYLDEKTGCLVIRFEEVAPLARMRHRIKNQQVLIQQVAEKHNSFVTPAEAGVQKSGEILDSRLRGNDIKDLKNGFFSSLLMNGKPE